MIIRKIHLINYRNYQDERFVFSPGVNVICGRNAQGKTNLLESIYLLSRGYSHRTSSLSEIAGFEAGGFFAEGEIDGGAVPHTLAVKLQGKKKTIQLDHKQENRRSTILNVFHTILFEPDDLKIVKDGPEKRRRFMNNEISGYRPHYAYILKNYSKIHSQRNALLKEIRYDSTLAVTLDSWDEQLVHYGSALMRYRLEYLQHLNRQAQKLHQELSGGLEKMVLFYQNNLLEKTQDIQNIEAIYRERLKQSRAEDIHKGATFFGPHVDDLLIQLNGLDAKKYGSQGQQRTAAISLKLSQIEIYKEGTGTYPVVLLDDILSELDHRRQRNILSILGKTQSFITCTDSRFIEDYSGVPLKIIAIENGKQRIH